jgi:hypothetical protein
VGGLPDDIEFELVAWNFSAQGRIYWWNIVNIAMKFWFQ